MRLTMLGLCAFLAALLAQAGGGDAEQVKRHRELERQLAAETAKNAQIRDETMTLRRGAGAFRLASELMTGARRELPPVAGVEKTIVVFEPDEPAEFVCDPATGKSAIRMKTLGLEPGQLYRFSADVTAKAAAPSRRIKFGLRVVLANGKVDWPGCNVSNGDGSATFALSHVTFDYRMPHGAKATLVYGLSAPATGSVEFVNVAVVRLRQ